MVSYKALNTGRKGTLSYRCYRIWDINTFEAFTLPKCVASNAGNSTGNDNLFKAGASIECLILYHRNDVGQGDIL